MLAESAATRDAAAVRPQAVLPVFPFTVRHSVLPGEHGQRDSQACSGSSASSQAERDALREVARRPRMEIAVVTGTSTGIGFATSLRLARHGYRVFAGMRNLGKAEPLRAAAAEARLPVEVIPLDVTSTPSVQRAFETVAGHGPVDVLVNNAGFGVRVVNVEPGVVTTSIFENSAEATRYDKTSPYQPIMRRNGKLFAAGFRDPARPDEVAEAILAAITSDQYRLRWPVGKDALGLSRGRPRMSDEYWVAMGDV